MVKKPSSISLTWLTAAHITCKVAFMEVHIFEEVLSGTAEHAALLL